MLLIVGSTSIDCARESAGLAKSFSPSSHRPVIRIDEAALNGALNGLCGLDPLGSEDRVQEAVSPSIVGEDMIANASFVLESKSFRDCD